MGIGKQKRKTSFGGILSIILLGAGIAYFAYLNYLFANDLIMPKITQSEKRFKQDFSIDFNQGTFWFDIQNEDEALSLMAVSEDLGKTLIKYKIELTQSDESGNEIKPASILTTKFCSELNPDDIDIDPFAQCLDLSSLQEDKQNFKYFPKKGTDTKLDISIEYGCDYSTSPCTEDLDEYVFGEDWTFFIYMKQRQFDTDAAEMVEKIQIMTWDLDSTLQTKSTITLKTSHTTVKDGFIIQKGSDNTYFSDTSIINSYKVSTSPKADPKVISAFTFQLDQSQYTENIQYAQYPEILAQFGSILNVLLLVGIIGVIVSKSDIEQYFIDQKLKEYYRQTAYQILTQDKKNNNKPEDKGQKLDTQEVLKIMKEIDSKDMNHELTKKMKVSMLEKVMKSLKAEQKEDYMKKKRGDRDIYETLYFESVKSKDIFQLQSELMHMKKIVGMLITPQQYAAIKCCGSSVTDQIPFLLDKGNQETQKKQQVANKDDPESKHINIEIASQTILNAEKTLSHIEQIDKIDYDEGFFVAQLDKFIKSSEQGFSNEDQHNKKTSLRLLDCLNKTYGHQENKPLITNIN